MKQLLQAIFLLLGCVGFGVGVAAAQAPAAQQQATPEIQDLGNQRYRVGEIEIDKARGVFTVSGQVLRDAPPLEFLVVTKGGHKAYEAVLEVNADAFEFNLACILIGLDASNASPGYDNDVNLPVEGDPVEVLVSWADGDKTVTAKGADLLAAGTPPRQVASHDWVYTGSVMLGDGQYLADLSGTLVGFVHRAETIIEHKQGIGLGNYGSVIVETATAPPVGTAIKLTIRRLQPGGQKE